MPATHTLNISDHQDDPYMVDWYRVYAQGGTTPLEQANAALQRADLAAVIVSEQGDDLDILQAKAVCERVALAASACAKAERLGETEIAKRFSQAAKSEALILSSFDYVNIG